MKVTRFLLSALFLGAMATTASAQGVASISWDSCTPGAANKTVLPGTPPYVSLYGSVINHSARHNGYEMQVEFSSPGGIRDAWRFDADGCQGTAFITIDHLPPAAVVKTCPALAANASVLQIKRYTYDPVSGKTNGLIANAYPPESPNVTPTQRYFMVRYGFDHTFSVNGPTTPGADCGGLEAPVCGYLLVAKYNSAEGLGEIPWAKGQEWVTMNDPNNTTNCPGIVPVKNTTWGSVKAQYKH